MKKVFLALTIVGATMALASCGNPAEEAAKQAADTMKAGAEAATQTMQTAAAQAAQAAQMGL